jgi:hypothetical protein
LWLLWLGHTSGYGGGTFEGTIFIVITFVIVQRSWSNNTSHGSCATTFDTFIIIIIIIIIIIVFVVVITSAVESKTMGL